MRGTRLVVAAAGAVMVAALAAGLASAGPLSIEQIQYTVDPSGSCPLDGNIVDCAGGIVTHKFGGSKPKITIQDPNSPDGWGAIQVKDWTSGLDLYNAVSVGDWVRLSDVMVEEYVGNTLLQYQSDNDANFAVLSTANALPAYKLVTPGEIAAPVEGPPAEWYVADHGAEQYEAMRLTVQDVTVAAIDLGGHRDNYALSGDANVCWAADYMNADSNGLYHPYVFAGKHFNSVSGVLEQYTKNEFDYYQLLTTCTGDLVPEPVGIVLLAAGGLAVLGRRRQGRPRRAGLGLAKGRRPWENRRPRLN